MTIILSCPTESHRITRIRICHLRRRQLIRPTGQRTIRGTIVWIWVADFPNDAWIVAPRRIVPIVSVAVDSDGAQEAVCGYA